MYLHSYTYQEYSVVCHVAGCPIRSLSKSRPQKKKKVLSLYSRTVIVITNTTTTTYTTTITTEES